MVRKNTFARGLAVGALVTVSLAMFGFLGAQKEAMSRRDRLLRQFIAETAQQRGVLEARVVYLERELAVLGQTVAGHEDQLVILAGDRGANQNDR